MKAYLTIQAGEESLGQLDLILYDETVPRTVQNFCHFLKERTPGKGYLNSSFHRIISGFMAQGGDFLNSNGTGCTSMYGDTFKDENFDHRHDRVGMLSMANSGKDTNGCQFFITFRETPHLDGKHVVFGHVDLSNSVSQSVLKALENVQTGSGDKPLLPLTVSHCGVIEEEETTKAQNKNDNMIDLLAEQGEEEKKVPGEDPAEDLNELELPEEEEEEEEEPPKTKAEALKRRMRKLKLKMNQARQLNKQEVLREGERLGSLEGAAKARKRQAIKDKKMNAADWKAKNAKALGIAVAHGIDGKHLVEQADSSRVSTDDYFLRSVRTLLYCVEPILITVPFKSTSV
jgi:cyclophilin family peptidyl-prolyl cis-trans isomerase